MSRRRFPYLVLLIGISLIWACGCSAKGQPPSPAQASQSARLPAQAWLLAGNGKPAVGDANLSFLGRYRLAAHAVAFDGGSGYAATDGPGPVDTTASFSVAAWVSLAPPKIVGGAAFATAVSQIGDEAAAFFLGVADGKWAFSMKDLDTNTGTHTVRATSTAATPDPSVWVHLVGVYDRDAKKIRLYLNGKPVAATAFTATWQADGPLTIGRSQAHHVMSDFWPGAVADVQIYPVALSDSEILSLADRTKPATAPPAPPKAPAGLPNGTYEYVFTKTEVKQLQAGPNLSAEEATQVGGFNQEVRSVLQLQDDQWALFLKFGKGDPDDPARRLPTDGGTYTMKGNRIVMSDGHDDVSYLWALKNEVLGLTLINGNLGAEDVHILRLALQHRFILTSKP
jgi:Concanavalin A-like lectin/glucanases superfamily